MVSCGACRQRGARCLRGERKGNVPGEVRHSLGEPSWRCHPHLRLILRSLLRHTPGSAATRPQLSSTAAHTCLYSVCVWNNVTQMPLYPQRQMIERADKDAEGATHSLQQVYYKIRVQVHGSSAGAFCLFQAGLMTNETSMFSQPSCAPVKAEPIFLRR